MRFFRLLLLLATVGCETPVRNDRRAPEQAESAAAREQSSRPRAPVRPPSGPAREGAAEKLVLTSGSSLEIPAGARSAEAPSGLPPEVKATYVYILGAETRVAINELAAPAGGCSKALDEEWAKMQKAQGDTDAERLKYRQLNQVERLDAGGHPALYSASRHSPGGQKASLATLMMCSARDYLVLMYAVKQPELPRDAKPTLLSIAKSYTSR